jgi:hypothetical protein
MFAANYKKVLKQSVFLAKDLVVSIIMLTFASTNKTI